MPSTPRKKQTARMRTGGKPSKMLRGIYMPREPADRNDVGKPRRKRRRARRIVLH